MFSTSPSGVTPGVEQDPGRPARLRRSSRGTRTRARLAAASPSGRPRGSAPGRWGRRTAQAERRLAGPWSTSSRSVMLSTSVVTVNESTGSSGSAPSSPPLPSVSRPMMPKYSIFTPSHRGGSGPPLVCLHGFTDTWRTWELVLPALERHHDVLAPTLPGHAGGPPLDGDVSDAVARRRGRARDGRGGLRDRAHRRQLARRLRRAAARRARPRALGRGARARRRLGAGRRRRYRRRSTHFATMHEQAKAAAPHAEAIVATAEGRRRATQLIADELRAHPAPSCSPTRSAASPAATGRRR